MTQILITDDDTGMLALLAATLKYAGYRVLKSESGANTMNHLAEMKPDLLIIDMTLDDMDGFELCRRVRRSSLRKLPIIMIVGRSEAEQVRSREAGADRWITKPIFLDPLLDMLGDLI